MADTVAVLEPKPPVMILADSPLDTAVAAMMSHGVGALLVTGPDRSLVGILTDRDFLTKIAGHAELDRRPVREFMTANPETVAPTDLLAFALRKMDIGGYRHLPVVEDGHPVGVISIRDILKHVTKLCRDN